MNFLTLEYFIAIAEEKSFTRASKRLFTSQQSLSEHIKKLEAELDVTLFKRGGRTLTLTEAGECLFRGATSILACRDQMLGEINSLSEKSQHQLTIAVATFDTPPFLSNLLLEFANRYPQYKITIVKRLVRDIHIRMANVNLYFSFMPLNDNLEHCYLMEDQLAIAVHSNLIQNTFGDQWPYVEEKLLVTRNLSLLAELPFILLYDKEGYLSQDLEYIFNQYHLTPAVGFKSENGDLNFSMCLASAGVLIAPMDFLKRKLRGYSDAIKQSLYLYPIDSKGLKVALALSYEKGKVLSPIEKQFIELTRDHLARTKI